MKTLFFNSLAIAALGLIHTSHADTYDLSGTLDVLQAESNGGFGGGTGNGTGTIMGGYNDVSNLLDYTITWQDLIDPGTVTNMHFHNAPAGASGGVDLGIPAPWVSPLVGTDVPLNVGQETNLLAGNWYVNVHTAEFPGGEIRGQVIVTRIPEPATAGMAAVAFLSVVSLARRKRPSR